jgi:hypothetical protein
MSFLFVVCVCCFLQIRKLGGLGQKKAHLIEIQVNGGASVSDKVDFATKLFEKVSRMLQPVVTDKNERARDCYLRQQQRQQLPTSSSCGNGPVDGDGIGVVRQ